jgi:putative membrane protein
MKRTIFLSLTIAAVFGLTACPESGNTNTSNTNRASTSNAVTTNNSNSSTMNNTSINSNSTAVVQDNFYTNAAQGGMAEVELSKLALAKSQNPEVKKFAQMMVSDHGKANDELKALAGKKNVKLPDGVNGSQKSTMEDLGKLSGAEFDKKYVETMVKDHEKTVDLFEDNTTNSDADIKAFATKTLPTLKSHLEMITGIQSKMK